MSTADSEQVADAAQAALPTDEATLQGDIERTREQLGQTVQALAAKADVQAQAKDQARKLVGRAKAEANRAGKLTADRGSQLLLAAAIGLGILGVVILAGRNPRRSRS